MAMVVFATLGLASLPACFGDRANPENDGVNLGDDDSGPGSAPSDCQDASDCVLAASTCCECPTFSVPIDDPLHTSCANVTCPAMSCPANVATTCEAGRCELACVAMECPASCAAGFTIDPTGCLSCECAQPKADCAVDTDCVEVRADCCGCARGGKDTAWPASDADRHDGSLNCPVDPQCPDTNVCEPAATPHCVEGGCALFAGGVLPPNACGRADLPSCPAGQVCVVNADSSASLEGLGVCLPPP